ncbi:L-rhamnose mutarotase [Nocardia abscessus]|uniref:L-rhamnose mutarotase n=1 Tax=Nocardia abscessus TaxID=120957 RepID=UPI001E4556B8|nr:L-rhamnose mutarotase [Nocardia abscessus]
MPDTTERVCFLLALRPERIDDYLAAHTTVWPEMLDALRALGERVLAGPVEATSLGNILVQARTHGLLHGDVDALRAEVATAFPPQRHAPRTEPGRKAS